MNSSINEAVQVAYEQIGDDTKFVRLTTITTIIHSIIFLVIVWLNVYRLASQNSETSTDFSNIIVSLGKIFSISHISWWLIWIGLILAIWYFWLPPIGEASLIHYLDDVDKKWARSLGKWLTSFFPMFEFNGIMSVFTPLMFIIFLSRFWMLGILDNVFVVIIIFLRWLLVFFASIFLPFAKYFIVLEDMKPFDAMKKSMSLSLTHLATVLRATFLQYVLSMRFIINILLFLGMPMLVLYTATKFDITTTGPLTTIVIWASVLTALLIAYINGIIEAFFITLRYRLFVQLKW